MTGRWDFTLTLTFAWMMAVFAYWCIWMLRTAVPLYATREPGRPTASEGRRLSLGMMLLFGLGFVPFSTVLFMNGGATFFLALVASLTVLLIAGGVNVLGTQLAFRLARNRNANMPGVEIGRHT